MIEDLMQVNVLNAFGAFWRGKKPVILIVDGHLVQKPTKVTEYIDVLEDKIEIVFLPPYASDLNPGELVWNQMRNIGTPKSSLIKRSR